VNGGKLYWRVAALDEGNNVGGFATGSLRLPRGMRITVLGLLQRRRANVVTVMVTNPAGRPVPGASVIARGAGTRSGRRRTGRRGSLRVRIRPNRRGQVTFTASKRGYRPGKAAVPVG